MRWSDRIVRATPKHLLIHFIAGQFVYAASLFVLRPKESLVPLLLAGIGKEIYDLKTTDRFDIKDIIATLLGGLFLYLIIGGFFL